MGKGWCIKDRRLKANTLVELLLTMIISGIIFMLVFDGVEMIKKFSNIVNKRLTVNQTFLYNHQIMEHLMENADSVVVRNNQFLFYRRGVVSDTVMIDDSFFMLNSSGVMDTLYAGYIDYRITPSMDNANHIDSLFIYCVVNVKDSVWLAYGLPCSRYKYLTTSENHEDIR